MTNLLREIPSFDQIEDELRAYEEVERERLGLGQAPQEPWRDENPQEFHQAQRAHTTLLVGGLTMAHDVLVQAALQGLGYRVEALECPNSESLHLGKEFGNRGQCNPTYFTVGNLIRKLTELRDRDRIPVREVVDKYLFLTAGSCGPCRFGTYVTEYRKALRDAGFDGFRVLLFQQADGLKQATGPDAGLELTPRFFLQLLKAIVVGDALNAIGYRIRPYEVVPGETDAAIEHSKVVLCEALQRRRSVLAALYRCRRQFASIDVDRLQPKPKVMVIGEFWAMTTEGDGNYRLQTFLEQEGAEVSVQTVTAWILYLIWQSRHDTHRRLMLKEADHARKGLAARNPQSRLFKLWLAERCIRSMFHCFSRVLGLARSSLPDMEKIASLAQDFYDLELRGGEGHMEVGKLIEAIQEKKSHLVVSVKPFGCMPSSSVSDGVQAAVLARHPEAGFCAVETTGDGEVNFQSRVQMFLFKAKQQARAEFAAALQKRELSIDDARERYRDRHPDALQYPRHVLAGTAANQVCEL